MSIGFTIPVVMLCHGPPSDSHGIGMIIICFVVTGVLNTGFAYFLAFPIQCLMVRHDGQYWVDEPQDVERAEGRKGSKLQKPAKSLCEDSSTGSSLTIGLDSSAESSEVDEPTPPHPSQQAEIPPANRPLCAWACRNPILLLCWLLTLAVGLPLRYCAQHDVPLATFLLLAVWLTTLAIQSAIKSTPHLPAWLCTVLSGLSNAVLWTALAMIAYVFADSALSHRPLPAMLDTLQTHTPLSTLIVRAATTKTSPSSPPLPLSPKPNPNPPTTPKITTGDLAQTILNSGLVAWGLKLHEHRAHLLSRAGLTVCAVSAALALANVVCGPLLAGGRAGLGVAPRERALAFAARSVTIALADPVMGMLGGDGGLNAAMVVGSGIVYQMGLGFGVGAWLERRVVGAGGGGNTTHTAEARTGTRAPERAAGERHRAEMAGVTARPRTNDPRIVAAGVTVGVNAAAMGTAYLYEVQSEAAPHAALAMIALGTMTVVFSSIPPLAAWIVGFVAG
ncbi:hypothetical protein N658DRAFT_430817 [Parathielavia hyrcaniae]|uniref:LrgB-like protein n=1 Tax=Parathielavia hyrcaniae TaxID=113614 RepID=A0AAN6Q0X1_9PEZI|nr:hypothetical protein N658DRAFT_430817 [Parathielavia hyrcaniae]